jgi:GDPmannose 4,6-dehydratase
MRRSFPMKKALITGITGQDGSYLAEFLLKKNYKVFGLLRRSSSHNMERLISISDRIEFINGDLTDLSSLISALEISRPDEIYNLGAQSFVKSSWSQPLFTSDVTGLGVTRLLEAVKFAAPKAKVYQASSSEMFGKVQAIPQKEDTPFYPRSPYGVAKMYGHWSAINYRESYDMFVVSGILFNHESPRRGLEFVTRKITDGVAKISLGLSSELRLGNLEAKRDWGFAGDYVEAMWLMLQNEIPKDYVISTGETHTVQEFCQLAFGRVGLDWEKYVVIDPQFYRPAEVDLLVGDSSLAKKELKWEPKTSFTKLVEMMVDSDVQNLSQHQDKIKLQIQQTQNRKPQVFINI